MEHFRDYNQGQLYVALGYDKNNPTPGRDLYKLWKLTHVFFKEYESKTGRKIPPKRKVNAEEAQRCALTFLEQEQGVLPLKLFPPAGNGIPVWPKDKDTIIMGVAHLFRLCANSANTTRRAKATKANAVKHAAVIQPTTMPKKRPRSPKMKPSIRSETENANSDSHQARIHEDELCLPYLGQNPNHPLPWRRPSKRFSHSDGLEYMKQLYPQLNPPNWKDLIVEWLSKEVDVWPNFADQSLQRIMHDRNIYTSTRLEDETAQDIVKTFMEGFAMELPQQRCTQIHDLVCERITRHTKSFIERHFIISEQDGTAKKTERFEKLWDSREEHWQGSHYDLYYSSDDSKPKKRRKRRALNLQRLQPPLDFSNLRAEESEMRSPSELAQVVESATSIRAQREDIPDIAVLEDPMNGNSAERSMMDMANHSLTHETMDVPIPGQRNHECFIQAFCKQSASAIHSVIPKVAKELEKANPKDEPPKSKAQTQLQNKGISTHTHESYVSFSEAGDDDVGNDVLLHSGDPYTSAETLELLQSYEIQIQIPPDGDSTTGNTPIMESHLETASLSPKQKPPSSVEVPSLQMQGVAAEFGRSQDNFRRPVALAEDIGCPASSPSITEPVLSELLPSHCLPLLERLSKPYEGLPTSTLPRSSLNLAETLKEDLHLDFGAIRQDLITPWSTFDTSNYLTQQGYSLDSPISNQSDSSTATEEMHGIPNSFNGIHNTPHQHTPASDFPYSKSREPISSPAVPESNQACRTIELPQQGLQSDSFAEVPAGSKIKIRPDTTPGRSPLSDPQGAALPEPADDQKGRPYRGSYPRPSNFTPRHDGRPVCPTKPSPQSTKVPYPQSNPYTSPLVLPSPNLPSVYEAIQAQPITQQPLNQDFQRPIHENFYGNMSQQASMPPRQPQANPSFHHHTLPEVVYPRETSTIRNTQALVSHSPGRPPGSSSSLLHQLSVPCNQDNEYPEQAPASAAPVSGENMIEFTVPSTQNTAPSPPQSTPIVNILQLERRRPYSLAPPPMRYSTLPDSKPNPTSPIKLSSDNRLALHSTASSTTQKSTEQLVLIFQKLDLEYDFKNKIEYSKLENSSAPQFFAFFAAKSGLSMSSLTQLTFMASFGNRQSFVAGRFEGDDEWSQMKDNLDNIYKRELKKNRKKEQRKMEFQIWVEHGEDEGSSD